MHDVAFELRSLLRDEVAARAATQGQAPDKELAMEILSKFGRPAEAAARYEPRSPLVDPADNHSFLIWAVFVSLLFTIARPESRYGLLQGTGLVFLWFAGASWVRRRWPSKHLRWSPKPIRFAEITSRPRTLIPGLAILLFPFAMYLAPSTWWKWVTLGSLPSEGLALADPFLNSWQRGLTLASLLLVVALYFSATLHRGWHQWNRRALIFAHLLVGTMLMLHAAPMVTLLERQGFHIFQSQNANQVAMPIFGLVGSLTILAALYDLYTEWARVEPAPTIPDASSSGAPTSFAW